jgi:predicted regulator of Ras-like GTPase activity (Roadblock/LC7/MglB family)
MDQSRLDETLREASPLQGLLAAYVGDNHKGALLASFNPANINRDGLAAHTAEVLRALTRLHSVTNLQTAEASYFVSNSLGERVMVQLLGDSGYYLAFVIHARTNYQEVVNTFKALLKKCQAALEGTPDEVTNRSTAAATAPSSQ